MPQSELIRPVHALLRAHAEHAPGRTAFRDAHRSVDYRRLDERTARIATGLAESVGVGPGDRVLICLGNGVTMIEAYLAVARASAVGVPVNPLSVDPELAHFLSDSGARAVITDPSHADQIRRVADPSVQVVVTGEGDGAWSFEDLAAGADAPRDRLGLDEPAFMLYTSGTTGRPKGVVSSVRNSLWTIAACYAPLLGLSGEDRVLWPLPLHHCLGHHLGTLGTLAVGASTYVTSGFAPEEILGELRDGDYTFLAGVPAMYQQLLTAARDEPGLGSGLRMCLTAGAVGSAALRTEFEDHFGVPLLDSYGTTETCGPITANTPDGERVPGSCGRPVPGLDVRLVDPRSGEEGDAGEVWVRGPNVMAGYHGRPDATAEVLVDGWYRTGDLATRAATGHLTIAGRLSELIVRGGQNVYPAELDEVLRGVPELADAAVAGRADDALGEVPVAYVVPRAEGLDADAVLRYCRGQLAAYKVPVEIRVVEAIPRTASGKVARHLLAEVGSRVLSGAAGEGRPAEGPDPARAAVLRERLHPLSADDRHTTLLDLVREETARVLDAPFAEVGSRRPFREMGLTSVNAIALRDALVGRTGCGLRATVVFDHPTPGALAHLLGESLMGEGGARHDDTPATVDPADDDPIVIVSMSCRYPGDVTTPEALWRLVRDGVDASGDFPDDRGWDTDALYDPDPERTGHTTTRRGGFLRGAGEFDNELFGISPREALAMDPQQRLLLELAWETLERAGIAPDALHGESVGVFTGVMRHEYGAALDPLPPELEGYLDLGKLGSVASGRIAYALGLHGPALTVDTACSSSLVALHLAVRALRAGECTMALAGAATVMATPQLFVEFSRQRALSPDGRCRAFSADADGTGWAEGAGLLLLERLSDARRRGHPVLAVVRGSALNSDGASNGLTAPNGQAQQAVIRLALADAGLTPDGVDAVEAHGTATRLGDPIEAHALAATYGVDREQPLWLGSLKSNIGHTQAAAGVGGVIKTVMALAAGELPPTLHAEHPSPHVDWDTSGLALLTEARPWPETGDRPRRAAVSAFGISGTNAHVILEQAPAYDAAEDGGDRPPAVVPLPLSARTQDALRAQARQITGLALDRADVGLSLATTRAALDQRAVVIGDPDAALTALAEGTAHPALVTGVAGEPGAVAFVFPGQGSQWPGMAARLLETSPVFREAVTACAGALDEHLDFAVLDVLTEAEGAPPLERAEVVQPVLFAVMVALARTWESLGVRPSAVIGHSQGELAAVHIAGGLDLPDAARIVALRSKALRAAAGLGGMASVPLPAAEVAQRLGTGLAVAAVNGPRSTVVSGDADALEALVDAYRAEGVRARRIPVDYASHSAQVEDIRDDVLDDLRTITPQTPHTRFLSTVTGEWNDANTDAEYWYT
ncbi:MAG TPA: beta-ketoacyl synthase N-terminal-like domain-containing protein, partial [Streptomyces sp.]